MRGNRTTERVDHPPRVREAIDELMREKEAMTADERMRMRYEEMRERYKDMKSELRRYRGVIKEMQRLLDANWANSDEGKNKLLAGRVQAYQNAIDMFKAAGYEVRDE